VRASALWALYRADLQRRGCSPRTIQAYQHSLHALWTFARTPPLTLDPPDVYRWLDRPANPHSRAQGRVLSAATRAKYASDVGVFYAWAWRAGLTPTNRMATLIRPKAPRRRIPRRLDDAATLRLFEHAAHQRHVDPRLEVVVCLGYFAGLRIGEIARLRVEDIWFNTRHSRMLIHGKGGKDRIVPLAPPLAGVLRAWLEQLPTSGPVIASLRNPTRPVTPKHLGTLLSALMREAGIRDSAHALRHTFAYKALEGDEGRNIHAVSWLLGHEQLSTTQLYTLGYNADGERTVGLIPDPRHEQQERSGPTADQGQGT
jgi:site-specific recombinase XerD